MRRRTLLFVPTLLVVALAWGASIPVSDTGAFSRAAYEAATAVPQSPPFAASPVPASFAAVEPNASVPPVSPRPVAPASEAGVAVALSDLALADVEPVSRLAWPAPQPTPAPTAERVEPPSPEATNQPQAPADVTAAPTVAPTAEPTPRATAQPTPRPTAEATPQPTAEPTPKPEASPPPTQIFSGASRFWYPALDIESHWDWYGCDHGGDPTGLGPGVYRWGCGARNNVYLLSHASSTFAALRRAFHSGALQVGQSAWYADEQGDVSHWTVKWIRRVTGEYLNATATEWASNDSETPIMTLQTCDGADSQYRIIVRLVPAD